MAQVPTMIVDDATPVLFLGTRDFDRARTFYRDTLGLPLVDEDTFALVFDAGGTPLRVTRVERVEPRPYTVLGWEVADMEDAVRRLDAAGVALERFDGLEQDERGVWTSPDGTRVAWFTDPDGNVLSLTEHDDAE